MKAIFKLAAAGALLAVIQVSSAQEIRCGEKMIAGDQIHPLTKDQILETCGEPTEKGYDQYDHWYYKEQQKILIFNGNGELDHIEDAPVTE
jgi:hypothetical protein